MIKKDPESGLLNRNGVHFYASARDGWFDILDRTNAKRVLLPGYIGYTDREGSGVFDPVQQSGVEVEFYRFNDNLEIDLQDLGNKLEEKQYDLVLVIHYFGFHDINVSEVVKLAKANGVRLVEDCAHHFSLFETNVVAEEFDVSFYSLHKYLHVREGGAIKVREKKLKEIGFQSAYKNEEVFSALLTTNLDLVKQKRCYNFELLDSFFQHVEGVKCMRSIKPFDLPQSFPLLIRNGLREKLYFKLQENGVQTTALYYRLIDAIDRERFDSSYAVSSSILNLPLHQDLTESDIKHMADAVTHCLKEIK